MSDYFQSSYADEARELSLAELPIVIKRKEGTLTLKKYVEASADFTRTYGDQEEQLLRSAAEAGITTTKGSLQVAFYQARKELGGGKAVREAKQEPAVGVRQKRKYTRRTPAEPRRQPGKLQPKTAKTKQNGCNFESVRGLLDQLSGALDALQAENERLNETITRIREAAL